jgi:guanine deaminase
MGTHSGASPHNPFMAEAIALSLKNVREGKGGPFAAVVVRDGKIIARGVNRVTLTNDPTAHAEVVAIREACASIQNFQLTGCEIYSSCEPCPMCLAAIYWARPEKVFFANTKEDAAAAGFDDSLIYQELALPPNQRKIPLIQLMRDEAIRAFQEWAKSPLKVDY